MKCIIYSAPFVLKKDVYAYEKSLASPKVPYICALKKAKTQKDKLLKMLWSMYVILKHCVPCSDVENRQAVTITSQSCPCVSVRECLRATEVLCDLCVCRSNMCCSYIISIPLWDIGQNQHITLCYQTPIKQTALFLYTLCWSEALFSGSKFR